MFKLQSVYSYKSVVFTFNVAVTTQKFCKQCISAIDALKNNTINFIQTSVQFSRSVVSDFFATPWTAAHQAPLFMGFPRQEY